MSRGDAIKVGAGIYIPNWHSLFCKSYVGSASENIPDGWAKPVVTSGTMLVNYGPGYDKWRCVQINTSPAGGTNDLATPTSFPGSIPGAAAIYFHLLAPLTVYPASGGDVTPGIILYNADESQSATAMFPSATWLVASGQWNLYDNVVQVNIGALPFTPDHCRIFFRIGGTLTKIYRIGGFTLSYHPNDPSDAAGAYTFGLNPEARSVDFGKSDVGRFEDTTLGQSRYIDNSGGAEPHSFAARFSQLDDADHRVVSRLWALNRGRMAYAATEGLSTGRMMSPQPIVLEPQVDSVYGGPDGPRTRPLSFYANFVGEPRVVPTDDFLSGYWDGSLLAREML